MALFEESVEIMRLCWAGEAFSFKGKHYTLEDVQIRPRPFQASGPPLWFGASVPAAARRAGRLADGFVGTPSTSLANATELADIYKEAAAKASGRPRSCRCATPGWPPRGPRPTRVYGPHVMTAYRYYWEHRLAEFRDMPADTPFTLENLAPDRLILGDPETCVREFQRWQKATGASTFLLRLRHAHSGGPPHAQDHGRDQALRRARAALLPGELSEGPGGPSRSRWLSRAGCAPPCTSSRPLPARHPGRR